MKINRIIIWCLLGLCLACTKEPSERCARVDFEVRGIPSGDMLTKTFTSADAESVLSATLPSTTGASLTIQSQTKSARCYTGRVGETLTLAYDTYNVSGEWHSSALQNVLFGKAYGKPSYSLSGVVTVNEADGTYPLSATWTSAALIINPSECAEVKISSQTGGLGSAKSLFVSGGTYSVLYVSGSGYTSQKPFVVEITPVDDVNFEVATFRFTSLVNGRWYFLSPDPVEVTGGGFDVTFPSWSGQ